MPTLYSYTEGNCFLLFVQWHCSNECCDFVFSYGTVYLGVRLTDNCCMSAGQPVIIVYTIALPLYKWYSVLG